MITKNIFTETPVANDIVISPNAKIMARVKRNSLLTGLSGRMGTVVFRQINKKTFVSPAPCKPDKRNETVAQRKVRDKFREVTNWAKLETSDPEKKDLYKQKATKWGLPNAYTAAIKEYYKCQMEEALGVNCTWDFSAYDAVSPDAGIGAHSESSMKYDFGFLDSGFLDSGFLDSGFLDSGFLDSGFLDSGVSDSGWSDSGFSDSGFSDSGRCDLSESCAKPALPTEVTKHEMPILNIEYRTPNVEVNANNEQGLDTHQSAIKEFQPGVRIEQRLPSADLETRNCSTAVVGVLHQQPVSGMYIKMAPLSFRRGAGGEVSRARNFDLRIAPFSFHKNMTSWFQDSERLGTAEWQSSGVPRRKATPSTAVVGVLHQQPEQRIVIRKARLSFRTEAGRCPPKHFAKGGGEVARAPTLLNF